MSDPKIGTGSVLPVGGPVPPDYVIGRTGEIDQLVTRLSESVHTMASGERRIGKTTICGAACARLRPQLETVRIEVPERRDADARVLLQLIIDRCNTISHAAATRKLLRAARPAIEPCWARPVSRSTSMSSVLSRPRRRRARSWHCHERSPTNWAGRSCSSSTSCSERSTTPTARRSSGAGRPLQRRASDVVVLVDGSDDRMLERMRGAPIQFDKLCTVSKSAQAFRSRSGAKRCPAGSISCRCDRSRGAGGHRGVRGRTPVRHDGRGTGGRTRRSPGQPRL